jgi:hypothetical protein
MSFVFLFGLFCAQDCFARDNYCLAAICLLVLHPGYSEQMLARALISRGRSVLPLLGRSPALHFPQMRIKLGNSIARGFSGKCHD